MVGVPSKEQVKKWEALDAEAEALSDKFMEDNFLSERWIKAKYHCLKETKGCELISCWPRKAGRKKCIPCDFLKVIHPDGSITIFSDKGGNKK